MTGVATKVLYITGSGRSCTTLLGHILGQAEGFCFIGEAMHGGRGLSTRRCGCGVALPDCPFWQTIRREAGDGPVGDDRQFFGLGRLARWRHLPLTLLPDGHRRLRTLYGDHWHRSQRLYAAVAAESGAEVIVDSSKAVPYGRMLSLMPAMDVRVVHLVRDSRAVAYSWSRLKPAPDRFDDAHMRRRPRGLAASFWLASNVGAEVCFGRRPGRYLRLRYEDFVEHPRESVDRIVRMVTERSVELPFIDGCRVELRPTHSVCGNPDRLQTGPVELRDDKEWKTAMRLADRRFVGALTWPLLVRYGYGAARSRGGTSTILDSRGARPAS
ncbi:MAG TPA: sulfotransferase [Methylomirabilota bacterium]|jgi:hypothetical protein|nr:sulfotransferase [Methylomirabilota bacterium]